MSKTKGLADWVTRINEMEMPAFATIVQEVKNLTANELSSANQVASEILKDTAIAAKVLRAANSVQYNPMNVPIGSISRAVVQIGYEEVKTIVLSVVIMEKLFKGRVKRERLLESVARSFHAATQAKALMTDAKKIQKEEAFVAGLLYNVGEMAVWGCQDDSVLELNEALDDGEMDRQTAVRKVLGTSFKALNKEVAKVWDLGPNLVDAYTPPKNASEIVKAVVLGEAISRNASNGWRSEQMQKVYRKVAEHLDIELDQAKDFIKEAADEAGIVAATFGIPEVCRLIPSSHQEDIEIANEQAAAKEEKRKERQRDPDAEREPAAFVMDAFEELPKLVLGKSDINKVFQFLVKAFHTGLNCQRTAIILFNSQRTKFEARYVYGEGTQGWREDLVVPFNSGELARDLFSVCVNKRRNYWLGENDSVNQYRDSKLKKLIGDGDCIVAPVTAGNRVIGIYYADNGMDQHFNQDSFNAFNMFAQQAAMALAYVGRKS